MKQLIKKHAKAILRIFITVIACIGIWQFMRFFPQYRPVCNVLLTTLAFWFLYSLFVHHNGTDELWNLLCVLFPLVTVNNWWESINPVGNHCVFFSWWPALNKLHPLWRILVLFLMVSIVLFIAILFKSIISNVKSREHDQNSDSAANNNIRNTGRVFISEPHSPGGKSFSNKSANYFFYIFLTISFVSIIFAIFSSIVRNKSFQSVANTILLLFLVVTGIILISVIVFRCVRLVFSSSFKRLANELLGVNLPEAQGDETQQTADASGQSEVNPPEAMGSERNTNKEPKAWSNVWEYLIFVAFLVLSTISPKGSLYSLISDELELLIGKLQKGDYIAIPLSIFIVVAAAMLLTKLLLSLFNFLRAIPSKKNLEDPEIVAKKDEISTTILHIVIDAFRIPLKTVKGVLSAACFIPSYIDTITELVEDEDD